MKCKLFVLCFLSLFIISRLASPTTATFKDTEQVHFHYQMEDDFNDQQGEEHDDTEENTESKQSDDTEE